MVQVIPIILTFHTHGTGISLGIISTLYRDYICSVLNSSLSQRETVYRTLPYTITRTVNLKIVSVPLKICTYL